jgi:hypothetical protein
MVQIPFTIDQILRGTTKPVLVPVDVAFQQLTDDSAFGHNLKCNSYHLSSDEPSRRSLLPLVRISILDV